jgi:hypothetical protein
MLADLMKVTVEWESGQNPTCALDFGKRVIKCGLQQGREFTIFQAKQAPTLKEKRCVPEWIIITYSGTDGARIIGS